MAAPTQAKRQKVEIYRALGDEALLRGDVPYAVAAYEKAEAAQPSNITVLLKLASAQNRLGLPDESAATLTRALRSSPANKEAASALSALLQSSRVEKPAMLDAIGLQAALHQRDVDYDALSAVTLDYVAACTSLAAALAALPQGPNDAARLLVLNSTAKALTLPLFQLALSKGINRRLDLERLLTEIRRILMLEVAPARFADRDLLGFLTAFIRQCWLNGHIFAVTTEEEKALAALSVPAPADAKNTITPKHVRAVSLALLYSPASEVLAKSGTRILDFCPKPLLTLLQEHIQEAKELAQAANAIPSLLPPQMSGEVTATVASHYENYPYPRWLDLHRSAEVSPKIGLKDFCGGNPPAFLDQPFKVLVAGAGTGRQAVDASYRYGHLASIVAIDLSRASLAYGRRMAERLGIQNIEFIQADLHNLDAFSDPFHIIECIGVMHHTPDVFAAWSSLVSKLSRDGMMAVGLYSAISRTNIATLRSMPGAPGASAPDQVARSYRASLMKPDAPEAAKRLWRSEDFYSLNEFRDLVLHPNEIQLTLPDIERFLQTHQLTFCGFLQPSLWPIYRDRFPDDSWPGKLDRWWGLEQDHPSLFDSMYQFWCRRDS